ncbi:MAG: hypothetical protein KC425_13340 [Anaerolineales bacterium]|nr:hypothetical protein [Anaerolineales bacterium]
METAVGDDEPATRGQETAEPAGEPLQAAFLVRCWHEDGEWRFSLENVATHRRRGCATLAALVASLAAELGDVADA